LATWNTGPWAPTGIQILRILEYRPLKPWITDLWNPEIQNFETLDYRSLESCWNTDTWNPGIQTFETLEYRSLESCWNTDTWNPGIQTFETLEYRSLASWNTNSWNPGIQTLGILLEYGPLES